MMFTSMGLFLEWMENWNFTSLQKVVLLCSLLWFLNCTVLFALINTGTTSYLLCLTFYIDFMFEIHYMQTFVAQQFTGQNIIKTSITDWIYQQKGNLLQKSSNRILWNWNECQ